MNLSKNLLLMALILTMPAYVYATCSEAVWKDAAIAGNIATVQGCLESNMDIDLVVDGYTALQQASWKGHTELVNFLLDRGADANLGDSLNRRPLYFAIINKHYNTVRVLLTKRADPLLADDNCGCAPLHWATRVGRTDMAELLLAHGAEVDQVDSNGHTSLHEAAWLNSIDLAKLLLAHGADPSAQSTKDDGLGSSPLHFAVRNNNINMVTLLLGSRVRSKCNN